jgi:hypothetical protein
MTFGITGASSLDVEMLYNGNRYTVIVGPELRATKWRGGQFVQYVSSPEGDFVVEKSGGNVSCGFLLFPSENYALTQYGFVPGSVNNWGSFQPATGQGGQNAMVVIQGNSRCLFRIFETVSLDGGTRTGAPITYALNDTVYISENGLLCNDSAVALAAAGVTSPVAVGKVCLPPSSSNDNRLGIDYVL